MLKYRKYKLYITFFTVTLQVLFVSRYLKKTNRVSRTLLTFDHSPYVFSILVDLNEQYMHIHYLSTFK